MKKTILLGVFGLLLSSQAFAMSASSEFSCSTVKEGLVAWIVTPARPYGAYSEEDVRIAKERCELLGGKLGSKKPLAPMPPGRV